MVNQSPATPFAGCALDIIAKPVEETASGRLEFRAQHRLSATRHQDDAPLPDTFGRGRCKARLHSSICFRHAQHRGDTFAARN
jgi:hypothetical protein